MEKKPDLSDLWEEIELLVGTAIEWDEGNVREKASAFC